MCYMSLQKLNIVSHSSMSIRNWMFKSITRNDSKYYTFPIQFMRAIKIRGYCHAYKSCFVLSFCTVERARRIECTRSRFEFLKIMYEPREKIRNSRVSYDGAKSRKQRRAFPTLFRNYDDTTESWCVPLKRTQDLDIQANLIRHESI